MGLVPTHIAQLTISLLVVDRETYLVFSVYTRDILDTRELRQSAPPPKATVPHIY
jgi:hypothetical protein